MSPLQDRRPRLSAGGVVRPEPGIVELFGVGQVGEGGEIEGREERVGGDKGIGRAAAGLARARRDPRRARTAGRCGRG